MNDLPEEIILEICGHMTDMSLVNIAKSCYRIYRITSDLLKERKVEAEEIKTERRNAYTLLREIQGSKVKTYIKVYTIEKYKFLSVILLTQAYGNDVILITQAIYNPYLSMNNYDLFRKLSIQVPTPLFNKCSEGFHPMNNSNFPFANYLIKMDNIWSNEEQQLINLYRSLQGYVEPKVVIHDVISDPNTYI